MNPISVGDVNTRLITNESSIVQVAGVAASSTQAALAAQTLATNAADIAASSTQAALAAQTLATNAASSLYGTKVVSSKIACGLYHTVLIDSNGIIYTSGYNSNGQLGNGTTANSSTFQKINIGAVLGKKIVSIACGALHTIALDVDGKVYGFGRNADGQLGDGTTTDRLTPIAVTGGDIAGKVIVAIACANESTTAIDNKGKLYSWGKNNQGHLGDGTINTVVTLPKYINIGDIKDKNIVAISCGFFHTVAMDTYGRVYTCGYGAGGSLGYPSPTQQLTMRLVSDLTQKIVSISCGSDNTICIDENGKVYGFGNNNQGQLGTGNTTNTATPTLAIGDVVGKKIVSAGQGLGSQCTIFLDNIGNIYTCGNNGSGQLGLGTTGGTRTSTARVNTGDLTNKMVVHTARLGYYENKNACIVIDDTGNVYVWGNNEYGQLGTGTTNVVYSNTPKLLNITSGGNKVLFNITGQHRCLLEGSVEIDRDLSGLIVVANTNKYVSSDLVFRYKQVKNMNDAIPVVQLSSQKADKTVFGVISQGIDCGVELKNNEFINMTNVSDVRYKELGDSRYQVNSIGEGCIWVIEDDASTPVNSGDLVISSDTIGYATLQNSSAMESFTVAKLTCSCNWNPVKVAIERVVRVLEGSKTFATDPVTYQTQYETCTIPEYVGIDGTIIPEHVEMEDEYLIRYVNIADGSIATKDEWSMSMSTIKRAALLGCTYHCG